MSLVDCMERDRSLNENVRTVYFILLYVRYWEEIAILIGTVTHLLKFTSSGMSTLKGNLVSQIQVVEVGVVEEGQEEA